MICLAIGCWFVVFAPKRFSKIQKTAPFFGAGLFGIGLDEYYSREYCKEDMRLVDRIVKDHRNRVRRGEPRIADPDKAFPNYEPVVVEAVLEHKPYPARIPDELSLAMKSYDLPFILKREYLRESIESTQPEGVTPTKTLVAELLHQDALEAQAHGL